jgi:hypothetical protein
MNNCDLREILAFSLKCITLVSLISRIFLRPSLTLRWERKNVKGGTTRLRGRVGKVKKNRGNERRSRKGWWPKKKEQRMTKQNRI